jgi:hypothetical protein
LATKILHGDYVAHFFTSKGVPPVYHAVVTKQGSREIVSWCQCQTAQQCEDNALETMRQMTGAKSTNLLLFPPVTEAWLRRLDSTKRKKKTKCAQG